MELDLKELRDTATARIGSGHPIGMGPADILALLDRCEAAEKVAAANAGMVDRANAKIAALESRLTISEAKVLSLLAQSPTHDLSAGARLAASDLDLAAAKERIRPVATAAEIEGEKIRATVVAALEQECRTLRGCAEAWQEQRGKAYSLNEFTQALLDVTREALTAAAAVLPQEKES